MVTKKLYCIDIIKQIFTFSEVANQSKDIDLRNSRREFFRKKVKNNSHYFILIIVNTLKSFYCVVIFNSFLF